ncbi:hypothetical protein EXIGLDRAFT_831066 [Exidia glandulosa HHB12029]|uniref:Uncharacterized protein n=1 Tax=Exidia glandulosa HHB12029 TaxID=1314781 RepID=A0A165MZK8_EXIGL|nr:hypothetical protein EXIGLDRAFT_831066 [Exidia glandulosa HHB12029]
MPPMPTSNDAPRSQPQAGDSSATWPWPQGVGTDCRVMFDIVTPRYMRYQDATLIRYRRFQLRQTVLEWRLRTFDPLPLIAASPRMTEKITLIQVQLVLHLWSALRNIIDPPTPDRDRYCVVDYKTDIYLLDALDTLYAMDKQCSQAITSYFPLFGNEIATCIAEGCWACNPPPILCEALKRSALDFHRDLNKALFERIFEDLDLSLDL